jgi:protein TonB
VPGEVIDEPKEPETAYRDQVRRKIVDNILYPAKARRRHIQGRTLVKILIDSKGELVTAEVAESSKHPILDRAALRAVKSASPFSKPPANSITLYIPITFKLI